MVDFNNIPASTLVPFTWVEIGNQALVAGPAIQPYKVLLIGQRLAGGTVAELIPTLLTSAAQASAAFGAGSQLHRMAETWFKNNRSTEVWAVALDDAAGATKAAGTLTIVGTATAAGTLVCYVAGQRYEVGVSVGDTETVVAASIAAALPADSMATAASALGVATFTAKNGGAFANGIDIRTSYGRGEEIPGGLTVAEVDFTGGAGNVDVDDVWPTVPAQQFNILAVGANDTANLGKINTEMADRWLPDRTLEGVAFVALDDTVANCITAAAAVDSKFVVLVGTEKSPSPWYDVATAAAGVAAFGLSADPARPLQTLALSNLLAPAETDAWTLSERDTLLANGVAMIVADAAGRSRIQRMVTTYLTNELAAPDTSFRDIQTVATLSYMRYDLRTRFAAKFPRHKLADDGTLVGAGQAIVTPSIAKAFLGGMGDSWQTLGILEDVDGWRENLVVERSLTDPNRLDIRVAADIVNQLRVTAARLEFFV